jgi:Ca2+-binding EF-hand superfamily protein
MAQQDQDWLRLQKKIFARYMTQKLKSGGLVRQIQDVVKDVYDGILIIELIEVLSGKPYSDKKPTAAKTKIQALDNCNKAMAFAKNVGVKSQTSAENIVEGNEKLILGFIFQIILKYMKFEDDEDNPSGDVKEALMLWLKNKTAGYNNVNIENFTKSFHDGMAFLALIHRMRPKLVNYDSLNKNDKTGNLNMALSLAEKYCNVERYLEPADIPKLDEVSMIVYLSDWYDGITLLQKQDIAAKRIGKLVLMTELHDKMRAEYKSGAQAFVSWADGKISELKKNDFDNTLAGIQKRLQNFYKYKSEEKSKQLSVKLDLESLFDNLAVRLEHNKRPPFKPGANLEPAGLENKVTELEKAELDKSAALHTELARQIRLHNLAKKFKAGADILNKWLDDKDKYFNTKESIDSVEGAEIALDDCKAHTVDVAHSKDGRLKELKRIANELYGEKFENQNEIKSIESGLDGRFANLDKASDAKRTTLEGELKRQKDINDNLCKEFADVVKGFTDFLGAKKAKISGNKKDSLETQLQVLLGAASNDAEADTRLKSIAASDAKLQARNITNNPYTSLAKEDCDAMWTQYKAMWQKKKELLEAHIEENKKSGLTDEQLQEIQASFTYFDKAKHNYLEKKELRACLQSLGESATPKDVQAILDKYDTDKDGRINFAEFQQFMFTKLGDTNSKDEILESFKYLAFEKDTITDSNLTSVINDVSWKERHVTYLQREMPKKGNGYDYAKWTEDAFNR